MNRKATSGVGRQGRLYLKIWVGNSEIEPESAGAGCMEVLRHRGVLSEDGCEFAGMPVDLYK